jgi:hypothetical protein
LKTPNDKGDGIKIKLGKAKKRIMVPTAMPLPFQLR